MQQVEIVEQVCSNLISLTVNIEVNIHPHDIRLSTAANDITPDKEVPRCEFLFHLIDIGLQFKRLRDFRFTTAELASFQYIGYLLQEMPAIESVEIMPWTSYRRKPEVDEDTIADIPDLPILVHLSIGSIDWSSANALAGILAKAPNLKHLALRGRWQPEADDPAMVAIRTHPGLEAVSCFSGNRTSARQLFDGSTQPQLTTLVETRRDKGEISECVLPVSDRLGAPALIACAC
jgi:hypothetical protein